MRDALAYIVASIVDDSDSVKVDEQEIDGVINFTITVNPQDMGRIIGKEGKVIRSIRNVMKIKAMKHDARINITLADTDKE